MKLSPHFSLSEMTRSETALRQGIDNVPTASQITELTRLCAVLLEPVRSLLDVPIHINSGFRSPLVNKAVGGSTNSAHLDGRAADIVPIGMPLKTAFDLIRRSGLPFDQIIIECNAWIHIAVPHNGTAPRKQMLAASGSPGNWKYTEVAS